MPLHPVLVCLCKIVCFPDIEILKQVTGGVEFSGGIDAVYTLNFSLKTANRLLRINLYPAHIRNCLISAEKFPGSLVGLPMRVFIYNRNLSLHHTENISCVWGVQEYMEKPRVRVGFPYGFISRMSQDECTISIDSSGELLSKQGSRADTAFAPVHELLLVRF